MQSNTLLTQEGFKLRSFAHVSGHALSGGSNKGVIIKEDASQLKPVPHTP